MINTGSNRVICSVERLLYPPLPALLVYRDFYSVLTIVLVPSQQQVCYVSVFHSGPFRH